MRFWCVLTVIAAAGWATAAHAADPKRSEQWYLDATHVDAANRTADGRGVLVAVLDSGVDVTHPDLAGQVDIGPSFVGTETSGVDHNGHGTNVSGVIVALAGNGIGIEGAAPGARVLAIRVIGAKGQGSSDYVGQGIDAAVKAGAKVINLSLGPDPSLVQTINPLDPIVSAVQRANAAGVVVVAAAGNSSLPLCAQPVAMTGILCVEAINSANQRSDYSNYGVRVDVSAPGGDNSDAIVSTDPGGGYAQMVGTSLATPQVAAEAALLVSLGLDRQQVLDRIKSTTTDLGSRGYDLQYGHGLINMEAAVAGLGPPLSPRVGSAVTGPTITAQPPASPRISTLLSRGLKVRIDVSGIGRVSARLTTSSQTVLARGRRSQYKAGSGTIVLRVTKEGRHVLKRARKVNARLTVVAPDRSKAIAMIRLRR
jgi:subtilisin family serine protease